MFLCIGFFNNSVLIECVLYTSYFLNGKIQPSLPVLNRAIFINISDSPNLVLGDYQHHHGVQTEDCTLGSVSEGLVENCLVCLLRPCEADDKKTPGKDFNTSCELGLLGNVRG